MTTVLNLELTAPEAARTRALLDEITAEPAMLDQYAFLEQAPLFAQELPRRVRETFHRFKREEAAPILHVTNNPTLVGGAGPTPTRYVETEPGFRLNDAEILHGLYGSLLGEGIGFTSQRGGSVYNTIIPKPELETVANSSSGSRYDFGFHVEDAFHPARADFIGLVCMRNDEAAATTVSCIDGIELSPCEREVLFERRFRIRHNPIHAATGLVPEERQEVLFGHPDRPYVRINAAALDLAEYDEVEHAALERVLDHFERNKTSVVLRGRDCIYIDNFRCVHARDAYQARFGPGARWLTRVVFAGDLRKSRALRENPLTRAIAA